MLFQNSEDIFDHKTHICLVVSMFSKKRNRSGSGHFDILLVLLRQREYYFLVECGQFFLYFTLKDKCDQILLYLMGIGLFIYVICSEFREVVCKIYIYAQEDAEKMPGGLLVSDDTQSCLDQSHVTIELSKSSSVGQPDSCPTICH